jgi:alpha-galactosidase
MRHDWILFLALLLTIHCEGGPSLCAAEKALDPEMEMARAWARALASEPLEEKAAAGGGLLPAKLALPFSFVQGSRESAGLLASWKKSTRTRALDDRKTEQVTTYAAPESGLEVRVESLVYGDFPAVEWTLHLRNAGAVDSPMLEKILPLDVKLAPAAGEDSSPVLHYAKGALCCIDDFAPVEKPLDPGVRLHLQPGGGRSSSEVLPFFNLQRGAEGAVIGIGWTGEWAADFNRGAGGELEVKAGMALTRLALHAGEEIRTPRILALFWKGDRLRGNNLLRRFLLAHHRPAPGGKPIVLPVLIGTWGGKAAADHLQDIRRIAEHNLPIELYWIDAEWFGAAPWWKSPGSWAVRKDLYPRGFQPIQEALHGSSRKFLLWFEPQRVCAGTPWHELESRPGWLLELGDGTPAYKQRYMSWGVPHEDPRWIEWESRRSQITEGDLLWNMGCPEARKFLTDFLSARIDEFGLDWYREDFNIAPLEYWRHADLPDRQGLTETRYVEGLYAMWDELLKRHPRLAIDNCASGGRRIDLETIGRSTALWRTDWPADAVHKQCHTFGLLSWVPLHMSGGAVLKKGNEYEIRSSMTAGLNVELPPGGDAEAMREAKRLIDEYLGIQKYFYGDYYPLTPYSQASDAWLAYQLHLPEEDEGLVVVLKRPQSKIASQMLRLQALQDREPPLYGYAVTHMDTGQTEIFAGKHLTRTGLEVKLAGQPDSALIRYKALLPGDK